MEKSPILLVQTDSIITDPVKVLKSCCHSRYISGKISEMHGISHNFSYFRLASYCLFLQLITVKCILR